MARFAVVVLLLSLDQAPTVTAEPQRRGELPFAGWLDAFWGMLDRVFSWEPTLSSAPRKNGAYIEPSGILAAPRKNGAYIEPSGILAAPRKNGAYIEPSGIRAVPRRNGAYIEPSGIRAVPGSLRDSRPRNRSAIMRR